MAGVKIISALTLLVLAAGSAALYPQAALSGKVTDLYSKPVGGATVVVRNQNTGAEIEARTASNGSFQIEGLAAGLYSLAALSPERGLGRMDGIFVPERGVLRLRMAMSFDPAPPPRPAAPVLARLAALSPREEPERTALATNVTAAETAALARLTVRGQLYLTPPEILPVVEEPRLTAKLEENSLAAFTSSAAELPHKIELPRKTETASQPVLPQLKATLEPTTTTQRPAILALSAPPELIGSAIPLAALAGVELESRQIETLLVPGHDWLDALSANAPAPLTDIANEEAPLRAPPENGPSVTLDDVSRELAYGPSEIEGQNSPPVGESALRAAVVSEFAPAAPNAQRFSQSVNLATRQGGEHLHGQAYLFNRPKLFEAQNPHSLWVREAAQATDSTVPVFAASPFTPDNHELAWGLDAGGRFGRSQIYWFSAFDGSWVSDPALAAVKNADEFFAQPTNDQVQVLGARLGENTAQALGDYSKILENLAGLLGPAERSALENKAFERIDWKLSERNQFAWEASGLRRMAPGGGFARAVASYGNHSFGETNAGSLWLMGRWRSALGPQLLAVTQLSLSSTIFSAQPAAPSEFEQGLIASAWNRLPQMTVDSRYGFTIGNPVSLGPGSHPDERRLELRETFEWTRGKWRLHFGAQIDGQRDQVGYLRDQTGTYHYANVENFISDALVFNAVGLTGQMDQNPLNQHNCDQTGKVWRDADGQLRGLGFLPCYSYYTQTIGPTGWSLTNSDWATFATAQRRLAHNLTLGAGLRWQRQATPEALAKLNNPELPLTTQTPATGGEWAPSVSLAWSLGESRLPVLRLSYGLHYGRTPNVTLLTALTQTGSTKGDLSFLMRPIYDLQSGGSPPFPYVLAGAPISAVKPAAVEFAANYRNSEVQQFALGLEAPLPARLRLTAEATLGLGRRLPVSIDTNFDASVNPGTITYAVVDPNGLGPIKSATVTVPFYADWPSATGGAGRLNVDYQQITQIESRANSTYEALKIGLDRNASRGLSFHARYAYSHTMDWNPNTSARAAGSDVLDPLNFALEYGTSDQDIRHSFAATAVWERKGKRGGVEGLLAKNLTIAAVGQFYSGLPYTMRAVGGPVKEFVASSGASIVALAHGMNGTGGDNRVYGVGRNTYRYPATWKADLRMAKRFKLGETREMELLAESFNLFNHSNVTQVETVGYWIESGTISGGLPRLNFLDGADGAAAFGKPYNVNATNTYRERQFQFGMRMRF